MSEELSPEEIARRALFAKDEDDSSDKSSVSVEATVEFLKPSPKVDEPEPTVEFLKPSADPVEPEPQPTIAFLQPSDDDVEVEPESAEGAPADSEDAAEEDEEEQPPLITPPPDDGIKRRWYAVHVHSGQEGSVQKSLHVRAEQENLGDLITNVLVPMEQVAEFKSGQKKFSKRKYFPGYILVQLPEHPERNPDLWHLIKDTSGVTGFIGSRSEPVPLEDSEVTAIVEEISGKRERPKPKMMYEVNERVKIIDGPFANFMGNIGEINEERGKMKVMIEIFERQTSVEVEFWQVEKN